MPMEKNLVTSSVGGYKKWQYCSMHKYYKAVPGLSTNNYTIMNININFVSSFEPSQLADSKRVIATCDLPGTDGSVVNHSPLVVVLPMGNSVVKLESSTLGYKVVITVVVGKNVAFAASSVVVEANVVIAASSVVEANVVVSFGAMVSI